jgi:type I restriction enzyme, S subunit
MNPERLLQNFNRMSEAPDVVPRLRRFILDLAVRGKLVEQDPEDEPASKLLKKIEVEKTRLVNAGNIRNQKVQDIAEEQIPFTIPNNWIWARMAQVGIINPRNHAADSDKASFVPMPMIFAEYGKSNQHEIRLWGEIKTGFTHFADGDVGLAKITPCFENGKSTIFRKLTSGFGAGTTELHIVRPIFVLADYILIFLKSPHFIETGITKMTGTAGQKRVPKDYFAFSPFPLPPLTEQNRIVAKVDELMALCDELEVAQAKREKRRDRLVASTLHGLNNGDENGEPGIHPTFQENARFYFNHIPRLTTRPQHIQQLRQTILNLAVRGKLVSQDPNDEPGSELLKRIRRERDKLVREGKIKQGQTLPPVSKDEGPFTVPQTWQWARVSEVADSRLGKMLDKAKNKGIPRHYLRNVNVRWFDFDLSNLREMKFEESELEEFSLRQGDVLICEGGEPGRSAIWNEHNSDIYFQKAIHRVRLFGEIVPRYFVLSLRHDTIAGHLGKFFTGVGIKHFTGKGLARYAFPLPPLAEQHRIVAKVDELMALCDEMESQITTTIATRHKFLEASLHEALSA